MTIAHSLYRIFFIIHKNSYFTTREHFLKSFYGIWFISLLLKIGWSPQILCLVVDIKDLKMITKIGLAAAQKNCWALGCQNVRSFPDFLDGSQKSLIFMIVVNKRLKYYSEIRPYLLLGMRILNNYGYILILAVPAGPV